MNADEKACPECAETIKAAAKVCKHCGHRLEPSAAENAAVALQQPAASTLDIFRCPSCRKPTRQATGKCRHCGARFKVENAEVRGSPPRRHRTFDGDPKPLFAGAVILLIVGGLMLSQCGDSKPEMESPSDSVSSDAGPDKFALNYAAQQNLKAMLKDGDGAKFEGLFLSRIQGGNLMLCGRVNSKNSFGAFTGFQRFIASPNPDAPSVIDGQSSGLSRSEFAQAYAAACSNAVERF